jgi:hypothetical protein
MFSWTLIVSIVLVVFIVVALYFNPDTFTLVSVVGMTSFLIYGYNRYWRHPEGFINP